MLLNEPPLALGLPSIPSNCETSQERIRVLQKTLGDRLCLIPHTREGWQALVQEVKDVPLSVLASPMPQEERANLIQWCIKEVREHAIFMEAPECVDFSEILNREELFYFALLHLKDNGETTRNSLELYIWATRALRELPQLQRLDADGQRVIKRACLIHDYGKMNLPNVIVKNPIPRVLQPFFEEHHVEGTDAREALTTAQLLEGSFRLLTDETTREAAQRYLAGRIDDPEEATQLWDTMMAYLETQRDALARRDDILALHCISPEETFKETLDRHESSSLVLALHANRDTTDASEVARVCHTLSRHHNNLITQIMRSIVIEESPTSEQDQVLYDLIRIVDLVSALQERRSYKRAMGKAQIIGILREEIKRGFLNGELTEAFIQKFLEPQEARTDFSARFRDRLLDSFRHGVERVDPMSFFEKYPEEETRLIAANTKSLMLTSFCRVGCSECGISARPYTRRNNLMFAPEPLFRFIQDYDLGCDAMELMLYDASDPLEYPYLFDLLELFRRRERPYKIKLFTACPEGSEQAFEQLLSMNSSRIEIVLSILPSQQERLRQSGVMDILDSHHIGNFFGWRVDAPRMPLPIGRGHQKGGVASGFFCGDMTTLRPDLGPCSAIYHLSTDFAPDERVLRPIHETRRVYLNNPFFLTKSTGPFSDGTEVYEPGSTYIDLNTNELVQEMSLRHVASYLWAIFQSMRHMAPFSPRFTHGLQALEASFEEDTFSLPTDPEERDFYQALIPRLMNEILSVLEQMRSLRGYTLMGSSFEPSRDLPPYETFVERLRTFPGVTPTL